MTLQCARSLKYLYVFMVPACLRRIDPTSLASEMCQVNTPVHIALSCAPCHPTRAMAQWNSGIQTPALRVRTDWRDASAVWPPASRWERPGWRPGGTEAADDRPYVTGRRQCHGRGGGGRGGNARAMLVEKWARGVLERSIPGVALSSWCRRSSFCRGFSDRVVFVSISPPCPFPWDLLARVFCLVLNEGTL